jgi:Tol biopolymer transport system component
MRNQLCFLVFLFPLMLWGQSKTVNMISMLPSINTWENEELGRWSVDGKTLLFSRKIGTKAGLYAANFETKGKLIAVEKFPFDSTYHGAGHALSPDGKKIIYSTGNRQDGFGSNDLYVSSLVNGKWSAAQNLGPSINGQKWDGEPAYGMDGLSFFFTSNRPGGYGGYDIWVVKENSSGHWSAPVNAGPGINTSNNEGSAFIHFDGRTMYFMRDGNEGMGGYDLYISHAGIDGKWKPAENMGSSINTNSNEGGLALYPDGFTALITRTTPSNNNDLFEFELPENLRSNPVQALQVKTTDAETGKPVRTQLVVFDINGNDTIRKSQLADEKGNITVTLDRNVTYGIIATADGYVLNSTNLPATSETLRYLNLKMTSLASSKDKPMTLQNIFFESGSYILSSSSGPELQLVLLMLQKDPNLKMQIRGHTDNVGDEASNKLLSENRAKAVYNFLLEKGIPASQISYVGLGETIPVAGNESAEGRQKNRRTDFILY